MAYLGRAGANIKSFINQLGHLYNCIDFYRDRLLFVQTSMFKHDKQVSGDIYWPFLALNETLDLEGCGVPYIGCTAVCLIYVIGNCLSIR